MDMAAPRAEALVLRGREIAYVGNNREALAFKSNGTQVIDAKGGTVMPGFIEGHMHLFAGAAELDHLQLFGVHGFDALEAAVAAYLRDNPGNDLIVGEQADYTILSKDEPVTRHHLDRIAVGRPFMMYSPDHHTAWANTIALEQAGILKGRKLGPGNEIVMGPDGLANGELREGEAIDPVRSLSKAGNRDRLGLTTGGEPDPRPTAAEFEHDLKVMKRGLDHCARHGITSIHNMDGNFYTLELLEEIEKRGELLCRVRVPFHMKNFMDLAELEKASAMRKRFHTEKLASGFVKVFVDGVLDSWTAVMVDDYADRPGWRGEPLFTPEHFARVAVEADRRGLQIAVHAIGDGAVRIVLDGYAAARRTNGTRDSRHRIEHIELVHPADIPRFRELGVIASMQPPHPPGCHGLPLEPTVSRIGAAKWPYAYAWNTLRGEGARLVFATDWPVSAIDPIRSVQSAMTRRLWKAGLPDHRQSLSQALASYTRDGAFAEFMEARKGTLKPGMLADVAVLSADLEITDPEALHRVRPVVTICDGRVTYEG
jgi:predicted amidohydrolase YtcJ